MKRKQKVTKYSKKICKFVWLPEEYCSHEQHFISGCNGLKIGCNFYEPKEIKESGARNGM